MCIVFIMGHHQSVAKRWVNSYGSHSTVCTEGLYLKETLNSPEVREPLSLNLP